MKRFMRFMPFWKKNEPVTEEFIYIENPPVAETHQDATRTQCLYIDPEFETWYMEDQHSIRKVCLSPLPVTTLYQSPLSPRSIVQIYPTKLQMPPPPPPSIPYPIEPRIMVQFDESKLKEFDFIFTEDKEEDELDIIKRILLDIFN